MLVLAVVGGGYSEHYPLGKQRWREPGLIVVDGSAVGSGRSSPGPSQTHGLGRRNRAPGHR